ncbi:MAG: three-Cys-motif partner protein TcmP [Candidatus Firestonebacteria bacterium]|nr:three-Cys-motif partner protein TcmP [Candidatus Firestonebacteria bacterium]
MEYYNEDFQKIFDQKKSELKATANLIFLDQNGIKHITQTVFKTLDSFKTTDFIFFIASSFFNRFGDTEVFKDVFPDLNANEFNNKPYSDIHRTILEYYKKQLPVNSQTKLYPFTIKKNQNIYGLIFGTKHVLGIEKFLRIAWDKNSINGEANFDIDEDSDPQLVLFSKISYNKCYKDKEIINFKVIKNEKN